MGLLDFIPFFLRLRIPGLPTASGIPGAPYCLTTRGNDQLPIVHGETDRTDLFTRLGQDILSQRWRSAQSSTDTIHVF
jgi:hypothetical protein